MTFKIGDRVRFVEVDDLDKQGVEYGDYGRVTAILNVLSGVTYAVQLEKSGLFPNGKGLGVFPRRIVKVADAPMPDGSGFIVIINDKPGAYSSLNPASNPKIHVYKEDAINEANRLAKLNPGKVFTVWAHVGNVEAKVSEPTFEGKGW